MPSPLSQVLLEHVGLGPCTVLCTEARVLYVRTGTWEQHWQVPLGRLRGVELQPERTRVLLQLFAEGKLPLFGTPSRAIECSNATAMQLVYSAIQHIRALYSAELATEALQSISASNSLRIAVRRGGAVT